MVDPGTISILASTTVSFLTPYLAAAGETVAKKIGEELFQVIKSRFKKKPTAIEALDDLAKVPEDEDLQAALRVQLKKLMAEDVQFAQEIAQITQKAAQTEVGAVVIHQAAGNNANQFGQNFGEIYIEKH